MRKWKNNSDKAKEDVENEGIDIESDNGALRSKININFDEDEEVTEEEVIEEEVIEIETEEAVHFLLHRSKLLLSLSKDPSSWPHWYQLPINSQGLKEAQALVYGHNPHKCHWIQKAALNLMIHHIQIVALNPTIHQP